MAEPADSGRVSPAIDAEREALLKTLVAHNVQFVVIGGAGIQSHGRRYDTLDIDLTPDRDEANLHRLADALNELDCRLVTDPANPAAWVRLPPHYFTPRSLLAATVWNLATRHGQLDLTFAPSGAPHCRRHSHRRARGCPRRHPQIEACGRQTEGSGVLPSCRRTRPRIADLRALSRSSRTSAGRSSRAESRWSIEAAL
jgi:hypothetical protein